MMRRMLKTLSIVVLLSVFAAPISAAPPEIIIHERPDAPKAAEAGAVRALIIDELLTNARYKDQDIARVDVRFSPPGPDRALVAYIQFRKKYLAEIAIVPLGGVKSQRQIEINVSPERAEAVLKRSSGANQRVKSASACPDPQADVVFATPVPSIATALIGVNKACETARRAGLTCRTLVGREASVENYQAYLTSCPKLRVFGNIGHGNPSGIMLAEDKSLTAAWFTSLPAGATSRLVIYFNSCQVHNDPLKAAVLKSGARAFIGGKDNLWIGSSEEVFKCFWRKTMSLSENMEPSLQNCERLYYPKTEANDHGFAGDPDGLRQSYPLPIQSRPDADRGAAVTTERVVR
jgi:hypothetical protein